jgi:hypothetical protein
VPVAGPYRALGVSQGGGGYQVPVIAIRAAAVVLPPRHFVAVGAEMPAADVMMNAHLGATQAGEIAFRLVRAGAVIGHVLDRVIDALHCEAGMQDVPCIRLVRMHDCFRRDMLADRRNGVGLAVNDPRPGVATPLAGDDYNLPLGIESAAVGAIGFPVRLLRTLANVGAVNLDRSRQFVTDLYGCAHRLAQLVQQHECALGIDIHVAAHFESRGAFDAVAEQRDHGEVVADRQLAAMKDCAARDAELLPACRAFPAHRHTGFIQRVDLDATAVWAKRVAIIGREADHLEDAERCGIVHPHDRGELQAACGRR